MPVVARKMGLDDQYEQADGSPRPRRTQERIAPVRALLVHLPWLNWARLIFYSPRHPAHSGSTTQNIDRLVATTRTLECTTLRWMSSDRCRLSTRNTLRRRIPTPTPLRSEKALVEIRTVRHPNGRSTSATTPRRRFHTTPRCHPMLGLLSPLLLDKRSIKKWTKRAQDVVSVSSCDAGIFSFAAPMSSTVSSAHNTLPFALSFALFIHS